MTTDTWHACVAELSVFTLLYCFVIDKDSSVITNLLAQSIHFALAQFVIRLQSGYDTFTISKQAPKRKLMVWHGIARHEVRCQC